MNRGLESGTAVLSVLDDELRRRIFLFVRSENAPVTRERVALEMGISRKLAAFHLDKLVEHELLLHSYARPEGKGGPGAGRPAKIYRRSDRTVEVSVPERHYELAGELLLKGIVPGSTGEHLAIEEAAERGTELGKEFSERTHLRRPGPERALSAAEAVLSENGFEPYRPTSSEVVLRNCPFHTLAEKDPKVICTMNRSFIEGIVRGLGNDSLEVALDPQPGYCCVKLRSPSR